MNSRFGLVIAAIIAIGLVYYVSHSRIVLHGSTLIWGLLGVGVAVYVAGQLCKK
ncbi:hypothetical protein CcrC1_gp271c [Caulobacter phage C1]|nr:hypothetical protein CcrC1_gp271c [Caulobacter phage C1]UTU08500.1 hypothetical protein CcrC2_gp272c [Caulobacter phage C2]UTU09015.1 hypothetical protein CcrJ4_gp266c [Caulobacter phage J4]UTU09576.1 hypothetical protein CcrBL47_gp290c [Caulobacter phage BL47]UTU10133.1 hypothetical protein CcrRB23_gp271c [Caulobacter phage RB23]WGN97167.1 hypothetical protein [Bertelyvirus sp.]